MCTLCIASSCRSTCALSVCFQLLEVSDELLTQMRSAMEDDNKNTRLVTVRVLGHVFRLLGASVEQDKLHNMCPDLLKRLDDSCDDIRVAMCKTFVAFVDSFEARERVRDLTDSHRLPNHLTICH